MKALSDLAYALQPGPLPPRIGYLVSATVNAIMAELVEHYYGQCLGGLGACAAEAYKSRS